MFFNNDKLCNIKKFLAFMLSVFALLLSPTVSSAKVPTFQDLMDPGVFTKPMRGMEIESAILTDHFLTVETTGTRMIWNLQQGKISFAQKLVHAREVLEVEIQPVSQAKKSHHTRGMTFVSLGQPRLDLRINGIHFSCFTLMKRSS